MIVVVEGVSAAGKTSWCDRRARSTVAELPPTTPPNGDGAAIARFWTEAHSHRWAEAERIESTLDIAYCDTDLIKLHYAWCMWRLGRSSRADWEAAVCAHRAAIDSHKLGFADAVVFFEPDPAVVRKQKEADTTRRRGNFELHLHIGPMLKEWYEILEEQHPGRLLWHGERITDIAPQDRKHERFSTALFDALTAEATRRVE